MLKESAYIKIMLHRNASSELLSDVALVGPSPPRCGGTSFPLTRMSARSPSTSGDTGPTPSSVTCGAGGAPAPLRPMVASAPGQPLGKMMSKSTHAPPPILAQFNHGIKQPQAFFQLVSIVLTFPYDTNLPKILDTLYILSITIFHGCGYEAMDGKLCMSHHQWRLKERSICGSILEARAWYFIEVLRLMGRI